MNNSVPISISNSKAIVINSSNIQNPTAPNQRLIQNTSASQITNPSTSKDHEYYKKHPKELYINFRNPSCDRKIDILQFNNDATLEQNISSKEIFIQKEKSEIIKKDEQMFGANTEYGKEAREEARIRRMTLLKKKNEQKEPMFLSIGRGRSSKKYKAMRLSMLENSQYCVLIRASADTFEAIPVRDWFKMQLEVPNRFSKFEDVMEEMQKIDKDEESTSAILNKKYSNEIEGASAPKKMRRTAQDDESKDMASERLILTNNDNDFGSDSSDNDNEKEILRKRKNTEILKKIKLGNEHNCEESDVDDHQGDEVDYMTNSSSNEEVLPEEEREKIYMVKNIDEEVSNHSDDEDENEDENKNASKSPKDDINGQDSDLTKKNLSNLADDDDIDSIVDDSDDSDDSSLSSSIDDNYVEGLRDSLDLNALTSSNGNSSSHINTLAAKLPNSVKSSIMAGQFIQQKKETLLENRLVLQQKMQEQQIQAQKAQLSSRDSNTINVTAALLDEQHVVVEEMKKYLLRKPISKSNLFRKLSQKRLLAPDSYKLFDNLLEHIVGSNVQIVNNEKLYSLQAYQS